MADTTPMQDVLKILERHNNELDNIFNRLNALEASQNIPDNKEAAK